MIMEKKEVCEGYKMTEFGEIPIEWQIKQIGDLFNIRKDTTNDIKEYPLFSLTIESGLISKPEQYERSFLLKNKDANKYSLVYPGDIVFNPMNLRWGAIAVLEENKPVCVSAYYNTIYAKEDSCITSYYKYLLSSEKMVNLYDRISTGTLNEKKRVHLSQFIKISVPCPSIKEQQKIAEILSIVDEQIKNTNQLIKKTKELKKGLMQQLLTKGIGHTEFKETELGEIPSGWEVEKLSNLINKNIIVGHIDGNHGSLYPKANEFVDEGVPYISANSIERGRINFSKVKFLSLERAKKFKKGVAKNNDVLFAHNATVGPVALLQTSEPLVIISTSLTLYRSDKTYLIPEFLFYYLSSIFFKKQYTKVMSQTTRNQVPITTQRNFLFVLPSIQEQQKIAEILSTVDDQIESYEQEKEKYTELKKGLMQQLLTGKIRVTV